jgi:hypothetical protein
MALQPNAARYGGGKRSSSVYSQDFVGMLSLLIEICDSDNVCGEGNPLPETQLAPVIEAEAEAEAEVLACDADYADYMGARRSNLSVWSRASDASDASDASNSSYSSVSSTESSWSASSASSSGRLDSTQASLGLWRRKQARKRLMTIFCEPGTMPDKNCRIVGRIYLLDGERKKWDGRQWRRVCCAGKCTAASRGTDKFCIVHGRQQQHNQQQHREAHVL